MKIDLSRLKLGNIHNIKFLTLCVQKGIEPSTSRARANTNHYTLSFLPSSRSFQELSDRLMKRHIVFERVNNMNRCQYELLVSWSSQHSRAFDTNRHICAHARGKISGAHRLITR